MQEQNQQQQQLLVQIQRKVSDVFENTTLRQIKHHYSDKQGGFCAAGIMMSELFGWDGKDLSTFARTENSKEYWNYCNLVREKTGKSVARLNDHENWTFKDFARFFRENGL